MELEQLVLLISSIVIAFATVVLVGITAWYANSTKKILKTMNKPEILISLSPDPTVYNMIYLCIQNIGTGYASNIKFKGNLLSYIPPVPNHKPLSVLGIFRYGIDYLPPGKEIKTFLFYSNNITTLPERYYNITATYQDSEATNGHKKCFTLDFFTWEDFWQFGKAPSDVAETLQNNIEPHLQSIAGTLQKIDKERG